MHSLKDIQLKCLGIEKILKTSFKTNDPALSRIHKDDENLLQILYQIFGTYYEDNCADELRHNPVLSAVLGKEAPASQPTLSRFFNRMDDDTLRQFDDIEGFDYHYQAHGCHPIPCYDALTGDLLRAQLRGDTDYCSKDSAAFMEPLIAEYRKNYPDIQLWQLFCHSRTV